ncbi:MAG: hypothetical protein U1E60_14010 [Reyranellaceae bacterium]
MDRDTDLFVQAFWVRCRETVRPELDQVVEMLKADGHDAHVATQEYSAVPDDLPDAGPSLILTVHPNGSGDARTLTFRGDVGGKTIEVTASPGETHRYEMSDLQLPIVKREVTDWLGKTLTKA